MQSSSHIITTNKPTCSSFFTGRMPFLLPHQQCQSTEGKISHSIDLLTPSSPGGRPTMSLTTVTHDTPGYFGEGCMPLISPLMPVVVFLEYFLKVFRFNFSNPKLKKVLKNRKYLTVFEKCLNFRMLFLKTQLPECMHQVLAVGHRA